MSIDRVQIELANRDTVVTERPGSAFWVQEGAVEVYIVPKGGSQSDRRQLLCTAREGDVVPAFSYRDADYQSWRFCLSAVGPTVLCEMTDAATDPLRSDFLLRAGLFDEVGQGFDDCLVNCYRRMLATDFGLIMGSRAAVDEVRAQTERLVRSGAGADCETDVHRDLGSDPGRVGISQGGGSRSSALLQVLKKCVTGRTIAGLCGCAVASSGAWVLAAALVAGACESSSAGLPPLAGACEPSSAGLPPLALAIACAVLAVVASIGQQELFSHLRARMQNELTGRVIPSLFLMSQSDLRRFEWADLTSRVSRARRLASRMAEATSTFLAGSVCAILLFAQLMWYSAPFALVTILACVAYGVLHHALQVRKRAFDLGAARAASDCDSALFQFIVGVEKVRTAGIEHRATHEYMRSYVQKRGFESHAERCDARAGALRRALGGVCAVALCIIAACTGMVPIGSFAACLVIAVALIDATHSIVRSAGRYGNEGTDAPFPPGRLASEGTDAPFPPGRLASEGAGASFPPGRLAKTQGRTGGACDQVAVGEPGIPSGGSSIEALAGAIDIDHVTFSYKADQTPVLDDVTLHIAAGESIGIVGPSGCGKSTLLSLLLGFEQPDEGAIRFDGRDMRELDVRSLRRQMGVVLQADDLIPDSICENVMLTMPKRNARETERLVLEALDEVGLLDDVDRMPMGIATRVGEGGCALSEGQRQRILVARALVREPSVLLLDEATSALDGASQQAVSQVIERHPATRIIVAHRLTTIERCDRIVVMEAGRIVQEGTYEELVRAGGLFSQLAHA